MTYKEAKNFTEQALKPRVEAYKFEAEQMVCFVTNLNKNQYFCARDRELTKKEQRVLKALIAKRKRGTPLQYLLKKWEFYGREFFVGRGVLIPRADTELIVDLALSYAREKEIKTVFDFCAGSGAIGIAVSVFLPTAQVIMVEKSKRAFGFLKKNLLLNKLSSERVSLVKKDIFRFCPKEKCDLLISNPPYIKTADMLTLSKEVKKEPKIALDGGWDGLYFYRKITENADKYLKKGGRILFEIGFDEGQSVAEILKQNGFSNVAIAKDLDGNDRAVYGDYL